MKFKREIIAIMLIICMLFTISAISAADSGNDTIGVANDTVEATTQDYSLESNDNVEILKDSNDNTLHDLQLNIDHASDGSTVVLDRDYEYDMMNDEETKSYGVIIDKNITIDGQNHKIDGKGESAIFYVYPNLHVTFKDIVFINSVSSYYGGGAISSSNKVIGNVINCTFIKNTNTPTNTGGGAISIQYGWNIINSTFINNTDSSNYGGGAIYAISGVFNIENSEFAEYAIKGIILTDGNKRSQKYSIYNLNNDIYELVVKNNILEVFAYCRPELIDKDIVKRIIDEGIKFHVSIDKIFGFEPDNEEITKLAMYRTLGINSFSFSSKQMLYAPLKRTLDIVISLIACLFLLPIYFIVKISYLLEGDKESILYTHTRIGQNGKEFKLYKFRSMIYNADDVLKELLKDKQLKKEWDENHKFDDDPRITKIGRFIRKTSLDEFPQFINVLNGDMSIIGPRPLVPGELKDKNGLNLYERVKPGITGWWACNGRSNISYEERLELEYYYVKNFSLELDIMCILKTVYVVLFQKGAK